MAPVEMLQEFEDMPPNQQPVRLCVEVKNHHEVKSFRDKELAAEGLGITWHRGDGRRTGGRRADRAQVRSVPGS